MAYRSRSESIVQPPSHPVPQLQGPFEESMLESIQDDPDADIYLDPVVRRNTLLEAATYTRVVAGRWKQKPGERYHPLWKLIAQISFGIHLLVEGMAKSEDEVMQILQIHVDEIDGFLERTTEDFDLAQEDIHERLRCLKLPMSHPATFDKMLEDRNFRLSIVEGNEKIEHIVERTTQSMRDCLKDVQKGLDSTSCLDAYLRGLDSVWIRQSIEHEAVFVAMLGNVEGWRKAFSTLHQQGGKLTSSLKKLTDIINEMQARAGEVSRRLLHQARGYGYGNEAHARPHQTQATGRSGPSRSTPTSRFQTVPAKQLPIMPDRLPLHQIASNDSARSQSSMRASRSQDNLTKTNGSRAGTPQRGPPPTTRQVKTGFSPKVIQIGSTSSARVQSVVPSLVGSISSPRGTPGDATPPNGSTALDEDEQPDRYFPPVELPAHVPEETMRQAPMSKQNRLSSGLGISSGSRLEKRNSRLGAPAAALVDLLRKPSSHRSSVVLQAAPPPELPEPAQDVPVSESNSVVSDNVPPATQTSTIQSPPVTEMSAFAKNNVRRPKKGVQHWFDAHDEDSNDDDDDKFPVQEDPVPSSNTFDNAIAVTSLPSSDNTPGTPSWANKSFPRPDHRRAELRKGAFSSHPPDQPFGSPPPETDSKVVNRVLATAPQRTSSHTSSAGTLGEPGPAVAPVDPGSLKVHAHTSLDDQAWKRASAAAPEVVVDHNPPSMPTPSKHFFAEMEGSIPVPNNSKNFTVPMRANITELEAPQQYFHLPPRSQGVATRSPAPQELWASNRVGDGQLSPRQQYFRLPSRESAVRISTLPPGPYEEKPTPQKEIEDPMLAVVIPKDVSVVAAKDDGSAGTEAVDIPPAVAAETEAEEKPQRTSGYNGVDHSVEEDLKITYVETPRIPLPPSPYESETFDTIEKRDEAAKAETQEALFLLPAVAYKAPASAKPDLEPIQTQLRAVSYTPPEVQSRRYTPPVQGNQPSRTGESTSASAMGGVKEPAAIASLNDSSMEAVRKTSVPKHSRNASSHGSHNGWKAFFSGQPSPAGSNLSIRSIQRDSIVDQRSPSLLSPASTSSRFPSSPLAMSTKDVVWFNKPLEDLKPTIDTTSDLTLESRDAQGLGISMLASHEDVKAATVSAT